MGKERKAEVVVLGGGTAGSIAAIAASRNKADCILVERYGYVGGTVSYIQGMIGFRSITGEVVVSGIADEMVEQVKKLGGSEGHMFDPIAGSVTTLDPEIYRIVMMEMVSNSKTKPLFHSVLTGVLMDGERIKGVTVHNKSGFENIYADTFVDASGDADLAYAVGADVDKGAREQLQPVSLMFRMGGFNKEKFTSYIKNHPEELESAKTWSRGFTQTFFDDHPEYVYFKGLDKLVDRVKKETGYELPRDRIHLDLFKRKDHILLNVSRITQVDATDADDLTRAEIEGRRQVLEIYEFLVKYVPGFENAFLLSVSEQVGIRETRRIKGKYILTKEDVLSARRFEDVIARGIHPVDIHDGGVGRGMNITSLDRPYDVPYRCLLPQKVENLIVAGRCVSATREAFGSVRGTTTCMATGQAAGTAAVMSLVSKGNPNSVDVKKLQEKLIQDGQKII